MLQILTLHRVKQEAHENSPGEQNLEKGGVLMKRDLSYRDGSGKEREEQKLGEILEVEEF